jgi:hypothetical protein
MKHIALTLLSALALGACSSSVGDPQGANAAIITVAFEGNAADTLDILVTDSATIAAADAFIQSHSGSRMISGRIERGAGVDTRYPFHFDPETVRIVDVGIEICDGAPMRTTAAVDSFFVWSTGNVSAASTQYCPWSSYPIRVQRFGAP